MIFGPHICGEAVDIRQDGNTILTGSYRQKNPLELWDIRRLEKFKDIDWYANKNKDDDQITEQNPENNISPNLTQPAYIYSALFKKGSD